MSRAARLDEQTEEGGATIPAGGAASTLEPIAPAIGRFLPPPGADRDVFGPARFKVTA
jgi:hypothetical protein